MNVTRSAMRVSRQAETRLPTAHGEFTVYAYCDAAGADHLAIVAAPPAGAENPAILVRVHSECITGEVFASLKCECGPQLRAALDAIQESGGIVVYLTGHEGRGIGLVNKLRAYQLQEAGADTLEANLRLGLPGDARDYGAAAAILCDLGAQKVRLLSNNPDKAAQLQSYGVQVVELVPLLVGVTAENREYMRVKRDRMGHQLPYNEL